jgi:hypothetical protein
MPEIDGHAKVGIDSMLFIYLFEDNPDFSYICAFILGDIASGKRNGVTSSVTLLEILVKPERDGNQAAVNDYEEILMNFPNLEMINVDSEIADIVYNSSFSLPCRPFACSHLLE